MNLNMINDEYRKALFTHEKFRLDYRLVMKKISPHQYDEGIELLKKSLNCDDNGDPIPQEIQCACGKKNDYSSKKCWWCECCLNH